MQTSPGELESSLCSSGSLLQMLRALNVTQLTSRLVVVDDAKSIVAAVAAVVREADRASQAALPVAPTSIAEVDESLTATVCDDIGVNDAAVDVDCCGGG